MSAANRCVDPVGDAITVLQNVKIADPSSRPDTEDARIREEAMRRVDRRYEHTLDECEVPELHQAEYAYEEKSLRKVEGPDAASGHRSDCGLTHDSPCDCGVTASADAPEWRGVYPGICINPEECKGMSHCPRNYSCCE